MWAAVARRWLWAGVLVVALVGLIGTIRYVRDARLPAYMATQVVVVSVLPPAGGGAGTSAAAESAAQQVAAVYGGASVLSAPQTLDAVATQMQNDQALVAARFGTGGVREADPRAPGAIAIAHDGVRIAVTGRAGSGAGSWLLATAAGQTLAQQAAESRMGAEVAGQGATVRAMLDGAASTPVIDPAPLASARLRLVQTLLLGLAGGMLLVAAASVWDVRTREARAGTAVPEGASTPAAAGGEG
jgi:hypothetical protein